MAETPKSTSAPPNCAAPLCEELKTAIEKTCEANGWPAGHMVLIVQSSGQACYCYCP